MNALEDEALRRLKALGQNFSAQIPSRVAEIQRTWSQAAGATDPDAFVRASIQFTHGLAGTAGILGLSDISRSASQLEDSLERYLEGGCKDNGDERAIDQMMASLIDHAKL